MKPRNPCLREVDIVTASGRQTTLIYQIVNSEASERQHRNAFVAARRALVSCALAESMHRRDWHLIDAWATIDHAKITDRFPQAIVEEMNDYLFHLPPASIPRDPLMDRIMSTKQPEQSA